MRNKIIGEAIGGLVAVAVVLWLLSSAIGWIFSAIWFVVTLPFRLLWWLFVDCIWGAVVWILSIFGPFGTFVKWIIIFCMLFFLGCFVIELCKAILAPDGANGNSDSEKAEHDGSEDRSGRGGDSSKGDRANEGGKGRRSGERSWNSGRGSSERSNPPDFGQRAWALGVFGLEGDPSPREIKSRYRELMRTEHPDKLPRDASEEKRAVAERRMEQINKAYEILSR